MFSLVSTSYNGRTLGTVWSTSCIPTPIILFNALNLLRPVCRPIFNSYSAFRGVNPEGLGSRHPDFGQGGRGAAGGHGGLEILLGPISYYAQDVCSKVVTFEEK